MVMVPVVNRFMDVLLMMRISISPMVVLVRFMYCVLLEFVLSSDIMKMALYLSGITRGVSSLHAMPIDYC